MEAITILHKIRQHGVNIKAVGDTISLSPKSLINDPMINFVREHKEKLLTVLYQERDEEQLLHIDRKRALPQGRIQVLLSVLWRHFKATHPTNKKLGEILDDVLEQHDYDIELAIDTYRSMTSEPVLQCYCRYQPPFCSCNDLLMPGAISCNQCEHFTPDKIGSSAGIGTCALGVTWTQEVTGLMPLFGYAKRHCEKFIRSI